MMNCSPFAILMQCAITLHANSNNDDLVYHFCHQTFCFKHQNRCKTADSTKLQ